MTKRKLPAEGIIRGYRGEGKCSIFFTLVNDKVAEEAERIEEQRKKQKLDENERVKQKWVDSIKNRNFICERQLEKFSFKSGHQICEVISDQKLGHFFKLIKGFSRGVVRDFYANMEVDRTREIIKSVIKSKIVTVTSDSIAKYFKYNWPTLNGITYPKETWEIDHNELVKTLTNNAPDAIKSNNRVVVAKLTELFWLINMVVHFNLNPHSKLRAPLANEGQLLLVFSRKEEVVDWASWIWDIMAKFREKGPSVVKISFRVMVTNLCSKAGVKAEKGDDLDFKLLPGFRRRRAPQCRS